jgi:prepilin-type N-terminal cleavage/methylation domain-containing protein
MKRGFTLIELLIVIGIVAALSIVTLLLLNPADLLRQSRDATRFSDMSALKNAVAIYLTGVSSPDLGSGTTCYTSNSATTAQCGGIFSATYSSALASTSTAINGTGWLPIDFTTLSSGTPVSQLPLDPVNDDAHYYAYAASPSTGSFEIDANMESAKYIHNGGKDAESTDGGDNADWYETGNAPGLAL